MATLKDRVSLCLCECGSMSISPELYVQSSPISLSVTYAQKSREDWLDPPQAAGAVAIRYMPYFWFGG